MGVLLKRWFLVFIIVGPAVILPGASAVDPRDYEESIKEDSVVEGEDGRRESSTEYPNGVNVIPGDADTHYPIYAKIQKSSFSCAGRIPGFYADTELRCQVWHICDESGVQQSFLCTNGTTYSQDKRVCDWWYNVNCDAEEVNRQYAANEELYKGPPPKDGASYEETPNNDLPPVQQKRPVQQNQPQQRPQQQQQQQRRQTYDEPQNQRQQNYEEPQQRPQHSQHGNRPQSYDQSQQRPQGPQNYEEPRSQQEQRPQQSERPQNYEQPEQQQQQQHQRPNNQQQQRQQNYVKPQQQQRSQQQDNYDPPQQARKQPPSSPQNNNYVAPPQPQPPQRPAGSPPASGTPEKKRVIVLRLPGPLPPGATIPPHLLMEYAESVLAAEREGKPPPAGLVSSKTVFLDNNTQRPQHTRTPPQQQRTQPPQQHRPHQPTPQQQRAQPPPQRPQEHQQQQAPEQQATTPRTKPAPKGPIVPYTPRPFSAFLEAASKYNGQTKAQPSEQYQQSQQSQLKQQRPQQQQQNYRPALQQQPQQQQQADAQSRQPPPTPPQQQQQQQQRRYEEPRQTPAPQTAYEEPREPHYRPQQHYHQEEQKRPHPPTTAAPPPEKKAPVPNYKPSKSPPPPPADFKKYRHSTRRNHGETKFAPKSAAAYEDSQEERQVIEESRRPAYFNNFQAVAHVAHTAAPTHSAPQQPQQRPVKTDVHLKSSFEPVLEKERPRQKVKYQEPTTTTERYLTHEEIIEPAIKRLVVAAGLKIKDSRNKQLTTPTPSRSEFNSEEQYRQDRNYEPTRVIVARKSTTTFAPTTYYTNPTTTTTTTTTTVAPQYYETTQRPSHSPTRRIIRKKLRVQTAQHHQSENFYSTPAPTPQRPQEPEFQEPEQPVTPRQRPAPKGPMLHYTPRPFSAFLAEASKFNGQTKSNPNTEAQEQRPKPTTPPQAYNEQEKKPAQQQQQQQQKRPNPPPEAFLQQAVQPVQQKQHRPVQQTQRPVTYAPTTTYRAPTTTSTTTTPYPYDDYYSGEPTKATKNFGFDIYGRSDNEDEEEELVRAAQEYYQASEFYGVKQRS